MKEKVFRTGVIQFGNAGNTFLIFRADLPVTTIIKNLKINMEIFPTLAPQSLNFAGVQNAPPLDSRIIPVPSSQTDVQNILNTVPLPFAVPTYSDLSQGSIEPFGDRNTPGEANSAENYRKRRIIDRSEEVEGQVRNTRIIEDERQQEFRVLFGGGAFTFGSGVIVAANNEENDAVLSKFNAPPVVPIIRAGGVQGFVAGSNTIITGPRTNTIPQIPADQNFVDRIIGQTLGGAIAIEVSPFLPTIQLLQYQIGVVFSSEQYMRTKNMNVFQKKLTISKDSRIMLVLKTSKVDSYAAAVFTYEYDILF